MNELKVGFLAILAIVSMVIVSMTITSNKSGFGNYISYKTILKDATGIYEQSSIKVAGIVAGRIQTIELSGSHALVTFEVLEQIKMTKFSTLRIKSVGFLGDKYLDIFLGDPEAKRLPSGAIVQAEGGEGFEQLGKDAGEILKDVKVISQSIREAMYDDEKRNVIKEVMANINSFTRDAKKISAMLASNSGHLSGAIKNLNKITSQLARETDRNAEESLMKDLSKLQPIMANVDKAVMDLKDIISDVKAGNGTVGKLLRDEEVIDKVSETLSGVNRIVNRVNNFKTDISLYSGATFSEGSRTELNVDLIPSPEKFFRVGLIQTDFGRDVKDIQEVTTTSGGASTSVETTKISETDLKFNLQIGRKINNWTFRVGLVDSTGGFGIDYGLYHLGFSSTVEAYDFSQDLGPAIRFGLEYRVWNIMYAKATAEDIFSRDDNQEFTLSAGLKFSDEDLAALFGLAI